MERTLDRLKKMAYWAGMSTTVNEVPKSQVITSYSSTLAKSPCGRPLQMMQVDVLEVPLSVEGNRYLLVVEDTFSKWLEAYLIKNQKSETITNLLFKPSLGWEFQNIFIQIKGQILNLHC